MSIQELHRGQRKARKRHQCFDCYRDIVPGTVYNFGTFKMDYVYTIKQHTDCAAASDFYRKFHDLDYDCYDGIGPLADTISDGGEYKIDFDMLRGRFPHVVCRLELNEQMAKIWMENHKEQSQ